MEKTPVLFYKEGTCSLASLITQVWSKKPFYVTRVEDKDLENGDLLTITAMGEVPMIYLDGTVITENVAVLTHIALLDLSKKLIFQPGTPDFDQFMRALGFLTSSFHKSFFPLFMAEDLTTDKKSQEEIKQNTIQGHIREMFDYVDEHLLRTTFMYEHPMAIDAYLFAMARWGEDLFDIAKEFPHIKRFQEAMGKDPGVQLALAIETQKQKDAKGGFLGVKEFETFIKEAAKRKREVDLEKGDGEFSPGMQIHHDPEKEKEQALKHG